jgi:ATP-dependent RNA helicase DHX29
MPKKKKTQIKPVARGFATVSVPKKVTPTEEPEKKTEEVSAETLAKDEISAEGHRNNSVVQGATVVDDFDPDKVEEQSLQNLVDRLQEKTEKEVVRQVPSFCQCTKWLIVTSGL